MNFRSLSLLLLLSLALSILTGCGGGGGGGGAVALVTLTYRTDWTNRALPGGGVSQRLTFIDSTGKTVKSFTANQTQAAIEQYQIQDLLPDTYNLFIELFSQPNLGGIRTGKIDTLITIGAGTTYTTAVAEQVAQVKVLPETAAVPVPQSMQFYAVALGASGRPTFHTDGAYSWQVFGGVGTVSNTGLVLAGTAGQGSVRATHTATSLQGSAVLQVQPFQPETKKWTVLVYINGANDLYTYSTLNMNQMEQVAGNPNVRFVVQWKQAVNVFSGSTFNGTRRYLARPDNSNQIASQLVQDMGTGVDMGKPETLADFIAWGKQFYPAERYVLVVWNHGNGWRRKPSGGPKAVSYDDETGNAIQTWQLSQALGNNVFDILAWDASLMQMLEVAYEVRANAKFIVGSEESPPGEGYPYHLIFNRFRDNPDATTRDLSKAFVDGMLAVPEYEQRKITQSVLDPTKLPALATAVNGLGNQLLVHNSEIDDAIRAIRDQAQAYSQAASPPRYYRDLRDVATRLQAAITIPGVQTAAQAVVFAIDQAIVWEGHNDNSTGSRGISIDFTPSNVFLSSSTDYGRMKFGQDTSWDEWLAIAP